MNTSDLQTTDASPYADTRRQTLLAAANDSARLFRSTFLAFLLASLYFLVLALSANDELLFKDGDLRAPILNVTVRASHYFIAAPWILLLLHINFLIQGVFLSRKIADYRTSLSSVHAERIRDELLRLLFPIPWVQMASGVSSSGVPIWLLRVFASFTLTILPLLTLGVMQVQFLDYQSGGITTMHMGVLLLDLCLLWFLWHRMNNPKNESLNDHKPLHTLVAMLRRSWLSMGSTLLVVTIFFGITTLRPLDGARDGDSGYFDTWLRSVHFLDVQNKRLYVGSDSIMPDEACNDPTLALNLRGRNYRSVNLADSVLCNVVLIDANLTNGFLRGADFRGANLSNTRLQGAVLALSQMQGAMLSGAQLHGAWLPFAQLQGANLDEAHLIDVFMPSVEAQGASLVSTKFWRTNLTGESSFQGASLDRAQFHEAILDGANFQGAALTGGGVGASTTMVLSGGLAQDEVDEAADGLALAHGRDPENFLTAVRKHIGMPRVFGTHTAITQRRAVVFVRPDEAHAVGAEYAGAVCGAFYPNLQLLQRVKSTNTLRGIPTGTIRDWIQDGRCPGRAGRNFGRRRSESG